MHTFSVCTCIFISITLSSIIIPLVNMLSAVKNTVAPVKVLVLGGCYSGLAAGFNLLDLCNGRPARFDAVQAAAERTTQIPVQIKVIDERDGYYHVIGSPLALASSEYADKAWTKFEDLPAFRGGGLSYQHGSARNVDTERKVATVFDSITGKEFEENYDYLIAGTGLRRAWPAVPHSFKREDYLTEAGDHIKSVQNASQGIVVIGGGAVGIEMAAELKLVEPALSVKLIQSRDKLLSSEPLPDDFKDRTLLTLQEAGVEVILGQRVQETIPVASADGSPLFKLVLADGTSLTASKVIKAVSSSIPSTSYLPATALDNEGYVKVSPRMEFKSDLPNASSHFAVGDIASWSGIKRCGAAMAMGKLAAVNIHQQLLQKATGKEPKYLEFPEVPPMIAIAVGKKAVLYGPEDGTTCSEANMKMMFGDDLGFTSKLSIL
ncbi:hypothetical protein PVAG01_09730 [Phlyctema vagabunda]|uniref:FAD/NAD(P)-binding domain-containing protein n=1 Tax=Phlyctema vagabunda TaxID=108571 RepID=A0ABR4P870_9HELO